MKFFSENLQDLRALYFNQLQKTLSMEKQIVQALPTMIEKTTDVQLRQGLQSHLQETEVQVDRVTTLLDREAGSAETIKCKVLSALVGEAEDLLQDARDESARDAAIIAAAQRVEHFEIAVYGTLRTWAQILGDAQAAETLDRTLAEERHADHLLTEISNRVNPQARKAA